MCSSPRASIGLSMLPASMAPSVAPAPTTVCSSSTNSRIRPSAARTSLSTALSRSSNSPRYLAPATSDPMSRLKTVLSFRPSGTSPCVMRWARPSTMAVFPTPGSPISTGLFLVLRDRIWMTRRISASRPMTGSSLPAAASATRSRPYFSRASYATSGMAEVTRWLPRIAVSAWRNLSRLIPCWCSSRPAAVCEPSSTSAITRCSTETYSSLSRFASRSAASSSRLRRWVTITCPGAAPGPLTLGRRDSSASRSAFRRSGSAPAWLSRRGASPSGASSNARRRCSPSISVCPKRSALVCASCNASWDFWVRRFRSTISLRYCESGSVGRPPARRCDRADRSPGPERRS